MKNKSAITSITILSILLVVSLIWQISGIHTQPQTTHHSPLGVETDVGRYQLVSTTFTDTESSNWHYIMRIDTVTGRVWIYREFKHRDFATSGWDLVPEGDVQERFKKVLENAKKFYGRKRQ